MECAHRKRAGAGTFSFVSVLGCLVLLVIGSGALRAPRAVALPATGTTVTTLQYGPEPYELLDLRLPDPTAFPGRRPVIVYAHSGGWIGGDRTSVPASALAQVTRGYALASLDYRLATVDGTGRLHGSFPGAVWDVELAVRFLEANAATWRLDPGRVVLMGASAGGYLAAFVGATDGRFEPPSPFGTPRSGSRGAVVGIVDLIGPTDLATFAQPDHPWAASLTTRFLGCQTAGDVPSPCPDALLRRASVSTYVDPTDPPIFLTYGSSDGLVVPATQGAPLARAWLVAHRGDRRSVRYDVVSGAGHNLSIADGSAALTRFLDEVTGGIAL